jgi:hypothetical protein
MTRSSAENPGLHPIETLWREVGLPEYFLGNGGTNVRLYALYDRITEAAQPVGMREAFSTVLHELKGLVSEGNEARDRCGQTDPNDQQGAAIRSAYVKGLNKAISIVLLARKAALAQPLAATVETFKCNCPHEVRSGCPEPKCPHHTPSRSSAPASLDGLLRDMDTICQVVEREGSSRLKNALADVPQRLRAVLSSCACGGREECDHSCMPDVIDGFCSRCGSKLHLASADSASLLAEADGVLSVSNAMDMSISGAWAFIKKARDFLASVEPQASAGGATADYVKTISKRVRSRGDDEAANLIETLFLTTLDQPQSSAGNGDQITEDMVRAGRAAHHKHGCGAVREIYAAMRAAVRAEPPELQGARLAHGG